MRAGESGLGRRGLGCYEERLNVRWADERERRSAMPKTQIVNPIISERFILTAADGVPRPLLVVLGAPYVVDDVESRCPTKIEGLDQQYPDVSGSNRLQALCLALALIRSRLEHVVERGDTLTVDDDDTPCDLDELRVLFGVSSLSNSAPTE